MELNNSSKLAVITGAGHRLGRCFALALAKKGYAILLHYHTSESHALETAEEIRSTSEFVYLHKADLSDCDDIIKMWKFIDSLPHVVDVLINSAATMNHDDVRTVSPKQFDDSMAINLRAPLICSQEAVKRMSNGGLIINVSDIGAGKNWVGYPVYTISKAGLEVLTRIMAKALAPKIRVNAIAPGLVLPPSDMSSDSWKKLIHKVPMERSAKPEEITSMVEYLIQNQYITGQVIDIDGGYSL